jgi:hypothetical protein
LGICERAAGDDVEIEFALTLGDGRARLGLLQVRPMMVCHEAVDISDEEWRDPRVLLASDQVMGNGSMEQITDVLYVKPGQFEPRFTRSVAAELEQLNAALLDEDRQYLLIGFGRWGSSDPWLGIPVAWDQISGARVLVEATGSKMNVEPSQGSHFFHNLSSFGVSYLAVTPGRGRHIDWDWLGRQRVVRERRFVTHARLRRPLRVKVDGRTGRGAIWR